VPILSADITAASKKRDRGKYASQIPARGRNTLHRGRMVLVWLVIQNSDPSFLKARNSLPHKELQACF
jgi:hypothetical protein